MKIKWTKDKCLSAGKLYITLNKKFPKSRDFKSNVNYPSAQTVANVFGSWNLFLEQLGYDTSGWTKEKCLDAGLKFIEQHHVSPRYIDFENDSNYPGRSTIITKFGTWNQYLLELQAPLNNKPYFWDKEKCLSAGVLFIENNNRIPQTKDFEKNTLYPNRSTIASVFGTWNTFISELGYEPTMSTQFGTPTYGTDGVLYRSILESYFSNNYLHSLHSYYYEYRYPKEYGRKTYDFYLPKKDLYIEIDGIVGRLDRLKEKIAINEKLQRKFYVFNSNDVYNNSDYIKHCLN
jgi:hypothetical protein